MISKHKTKMKLLFKTLDNFTFHLDLDPSTKISDVKDVVVNHDPSRFRLDGMRLISAGNMLKDEMTLADHNISEKSFVVVMCNKPKVEMPPPPPPPPPQAIAPQIPSVPQEDYSGFAGGTVGRNELVTRLVDMGFERNKVERALQASFYNPERAVEYLATDSIPSHAINTPASSSSAISLSIPADFDSQDPTATLQILRTQPGFAQLRRVVQSDPNMLSSLVAQIGEQNPDFLRFIETNPDAFLELLNSDDASVPPSSSGNDHMAAAAPVLPPQQFPTMPQGFNLDDRDKQAIERLKDLGYSELACIQAYFACDKNEEAAANLLLEGDFDDAQGGR
ncbi:hypothetical protein ACOME3_006724 [Neoechinorhynchus agilis]